MVRAVLYARISDSDPASESVDRQLRSLRKTAATEGWRIVKEFRDDGISGAKVREKAERALDMLRRGEADILAVWKADRWSRQGLRAIADLEDVLAQRPTARFVATEDKFDFCNDGFDQMFDLKALIARWYRKDVSVHVRAQIDDYRRKGWYPGGNVPYGYTTEPNPEGKGRRLVINDVEAEVVRAAARLVTNGESLYDIVYNLNRLNVPTRRGTTWSIQSLRQVLTGDPILGRVTHHGDLLRGDDGLPRTYWPPVLDLATWSEVRVALGVGTAGAARPPRRRRARLLSGILVCALCGAPLYVRVNGAGHEAYGCSARSNGRVCAGVSISADGLEAYIASWFNELLGDVEMEKEVVDASEQEAALAEVARAIEETKRAMDPDDADMDALFAQIAVLKQRRAEIRDMPIEPKVTRVPSGQTFREAWAGADLTLRRQIVQGLFSAIRVKKGRRGSRTFDTLRLELVVRLPESVRHLVKDPDDVVISAA
jgi:site-specific DNA recombinase